MASSSTTSRTPRITSVQASFSRVFGQRCFYLFVSLIVLIVMAPFVADSDRGRVLINVIQGLVLVSAVAAVGRGVTPFVIAVLLAIPAGGFAFIAITLQDDPTHNFMLATAFYLAFYIVTVVYLLRYVFSPDVMTDDKLFGAASGYLMLGILWAYAYRLVQYLDPAAFGVRPGDAPREFYDLLYMSFGCLTSNGPGDVLPTSSKVRSLVILEQLSGTLFVAILVARLAGIYPPKKEG